MMGSILLGSKDNSDKNSFKTPPEMVDKESETEHDDNLNPPEISEDELGNDFLTTQRTIQQWTCISSATTQIF